MLAEVSFLIISKLQETRRACPSFFCCPTTNRQCQLCRHDAITVAVAATADESLHRRCRPLEPSYLGCYYTHYQCIIVRRLKCVVAIELVWPFLLAAPPVSRSSPLSIADCRSQHRTIARLPLQAGHRPNLLASELTLTKPDSFSIQSLRS